jgi:peptide-methionine (S)-S-oxide reductase
MGAAGSMFFFGSGRSAHANSAGVLPKPAVDLPAGDLKPGETRTAVLAGGCFWCLEAVFQQLEGVDKVVSGYAGGSKDTANYEAVCNGDTGHAESIEITYEPAKISYGQLLRVFFAVIDPTTKNAQGPDHGTQYRSAIFYETDEQKKVADAYIKQLTDAKSFDRPIVTTIEALKPGTFYPAELYHQNYAVCHPNNPYIRAEALPKVEKVREKFPDQLKGAASTTQP